MNLWEFSRSETDAIASVESIFTVLGLIVAVSWALDHFFTRREKYPRAIVTQTVQFWEHGEDWLIRVNLHIKNEGHVLLETSSGHTWIQQMQPWPEVEIVEFKEGLNLVQVPVSNLVATPEAEEAIQAAASVANTFALGIGSTLALALGGLCHGYRQVRTAWSTKRSSRAWRQPGRC